ncbi:MAG: YceI family protein [Candidatus Hydrogenedentes bacterium]|nr:YceI family protein [Candidatus Hydrogenedentota bacterium]
MTECPTALIRQTKMLGARPRRISLFAFLLASRVCAAAPVSYQVQASESVFAVITHPAGPAATFAHDHLVFPDKFEAELSLESELVESAQFKLRFSANALQVALPEVQQRWHPALHSLGAMPEPFSKISASNRALVRKHMLGDKQLDADKFSDISAELKQITPKKTVKGEKSFEYEAVVALTVHGKTVEHPFATNVTVKDGRLEIEAVGSYQFTDFGLKPYSAYFGTVRNADPFYVYVNFTATATRPNA